MYVLKKVVVYIHTHILDYHSAIKNAICRSMDEPGAYCTKRSKPDRERQKLYDATHLYNIKSTN